MNDRITDLYNNYISEYSEIYGNDIWYNRHKNTCEFAQKIIASIKSGYGIEDSIIVNKNNILEIQDLQTFYRHYWKKQSNGISDIGQGAFSENDFNKIVQYEYNGMTFKQLNEAIIINPVDEYENTIQWFKSCKSSISNIRISWVSINRFFAAFIPNIISTTVDEKKIDIVIKKYGLDIHESNWIKKNIRIMREIPAVDHNFDIYMRGEFVWYLFQNRDDVHTLYEKVVGSWSKPNKGQNFIARKKVDWSIFEDGSHIPIAFIEDFEKANGGKHIDLGTKFDVTLIIDEKRYNAVLSNIDRKDVNVDTVQIRYDSNNELKQYLMNELQSSYNYITSERLKKKEDKDRSKIIVPDPIAEYLDFYETGIPFCYRVEIINNVQEDDLDVNQNRNVWWVNQGSTLSKELQEGILWAPLKDKSGKTQYHWETVAELRGNDIILNYSNGFIRYISRVLMPAIEAPKPDSMKSNGWEEKGRLVSVEYFELTPAIPIEKISNELIKLNIKEGPIHSGGGVKQGYLFRLTIEALSAIQKLSPETQWPAFSFINDFQDEVFTIAENEIPNNVIVDFDIKKEVERIAEYIKSKGFTYDDNTIMNFYLALKTKPFVILAGTSGTGKSKLVKLFAEALGATSNNGRYRLVSVRPDWSDSTDLLGYRDLKGNFQPGLLTSFLKEAENKPVPYFICLDEMNLARVEYYLSDILSVMESRKWAEDKIITDKLFCNETFGNHNEAKMAYGKVYIPENVYFVGTVNMDETTFPFSKKVLDRANTIEFSHVELEPKFSIIEEGKAVCLHNSFLRSDFLILNDCKDYQEDLSQVILTLKQINETLQKANLHFGYRIRDEISFYMIYNKINDLMAFDQAMDYQILQKILPRIQGSSAHIKQLLFDLFAICADNRMKDFSYQDSGIYEKVFQYIESFGVKYKRSAYKIAFMLRRFEEDGFTSYWM